MLTELNQNKREYNMEKTHLPITTGLQNCGRSALTSFITFHLVLWGATEVLQVISQFLKPANRYRAFNEPLSIRQMSLQTNQHLNILGIVALTCCFCFSVAYD